MVVPGPAGPPLSGLRVVDLSSWIAGGYCSKLLTDGGADVIKVERRDGDPLRRWSASGSEVSAATDGALFNHLHASQTSVVIEADGPELQELLASASMVIWSNGPVPAPAPLVPPSDMLRAHPHLVIGAISPFGLDGPWAGRPATEFTLQAWSGGVIRIARGRPDLSPTYVGGQVGEWMTGLYTSIGMLAAWRCGGGQMVDVSMLECLAATLTYYPVTFHDLLGRPIREDRFVPTPGIAAARDGIVGLGTGTGQQWFDFCAMVGHPEWIENRSYLVDRTMLAPEIDAWVAERTVAEIVELATAFRLPNSPVVSGASAPELEHLRARSSFVRNPRDGALNPAPPNRFESFRLRERTPAPALGSSNAVPSTPPAPSLHPSSTLPFAGLRVLDMTAFWAGPMTGHLLALLGADVIHLESANRPDGARSVGGVPQTEDGYLERGPIFAALNTNKRGLAIDTRRPAGAEVLKRVIASCDVLVENYTPRVLEQLGLDAASLRAINPRLITVRMPGFGLDGPWRDGPAFAFVIENASGLTWLSGHPEALPIEPYSIGDPNAGLHALYGLQLALEHRDRTGDGGLVESAMIDAALNIAAEQVTEASAHGAELSRAGNRGPLAAPQNLYQVDGLDEYGRDDCWVAIAVTSDAQWRALVDALSTPEWATSPTFGDAAGRRAAHDEIDAHLASWCRSRSSDDVVELLWGAGVPVAPVIQPHRQVDLPPLQYRRFFEPVDHPVAGTARASTLPIVFGRGPSQWHRRHAPLLGEHSVAILGEVGLSPEEIAALAADGVIGEASGPT